MIWEVMLLSHLESCICSVKRLVMVLKTVRCLPESLRNDNAERGTEAIPNSWQRVISGKPARDLSSGSGLVVLQVFQQTEVRSLANLQQRNGTGRVAKLTRVSSLDCTLVIKTTHTSFLCLPKDFVVKHETHPSALCRCSRSHLRTLVG